MNGIRHTASASAGWLGVDWGSIGLVFVVGLVATLVIVGLYTAGIRLLAVGAPDIQVGADGDPEGQDAVVSARVGTRPVAATIGGFACFAGFAAAVLVGVYLVIPAFHGH
ncbi:hypothetical protein [Microbacterium sp. T32]|uniref:hypothetical protein n=1 Tax=Microbacterium sp. T32 TaxID=1776083 RepID=UPI0007ABF88C|nr:hypothetical protein [Microbacterium sp. T32]KZE41509.1 hypothetical protein AVW09_02665 [Microbacterium sp. T32]